MSHPHTLGNQTPIHTLYDRISISVSGSRVEDTSYMSQAHAEPSLTCSDLESHVQVIDTSFPASGGTVICRTAAQLPADG